MATWIKGPLSDGFRPQEIAVIVRSEQQLRRARDAAKAADVDAVELSEKVATQPDNVSVGIMHFAKGLEFRAVAVMACDDEVLTLQERTETVADEADLEEACTAERHLLYVAAMRARERLLLTGVDPASEFLTDLGDRTGR